MTCIVGIQTENQVVVAADSMSSDGYCKVPRADPKIFRMKNDDIVIGCTTSYRMIQILKYHLEIDQCSSRNDNMGFMVQNFVPAVRKAFEEHGWMGKDEERDRGGNFIVGVRNELFVICDDFQVMKPARGYHAIGSGYAYALGVLADLKRFSKIKLANKCIAKRAILAAAEHDAFVNDDVLIEVTEGW